MKKSKHSSYLKVIAFVLIAIVIISTFGFVSGGWQPILDPEGGNEENNDTPLDTPGTDTDDTPVASDPKYYHFITGKETDEAGERRMPLVFVTDPSATLYGISGALLTIELPIEDEGSRMLVFSDELQLLGKIGQIEPTRGYISNLVGYFGGILISHGSDDMVEYPSHDVSQHHADLSVMSGFHYTEGALAYTNGDLIQAALRQLESASTVDPSQKIPYCFADPEEALAPLPKSASSVYLPISRASATELVFNPESCRYSYLKGGIAKTDALNASAIEYDNVFVLLTDSVTYETADGTELIPKTDGSGTGYYLTAGGYTEIKWVSEDGELTFYDADDNKLRINRGSSYISFVKSSLADLITFTE